MVNINIQIPDELHKELKIQAAIESKALKEIIIEKLSTQGSIKKVGQ